MVFSTQIKPNICPVCKAILDGVTSIKEETGPNANSFSVCCYCGVILRFSEDLTLLLATPEDILEIKKEPESYNQLLFVQHVVHALILERRVRNAMIN